MSIFQERSERARAMLRAKLPSLPKGQRIQMKDFAALLVPEGIILSPAALSQAVGAMVEEGLLIRLTKKTLAVPGEAQERGESKRIRDLEKAVKTLRHDLGELAAQLNGRLL